MPAPDNHMLPLVDDREAFARLHGLLYDRLFFYAFKQLGDAGEAENLVQDSFVLYWEHRADFSDIVAIKAYLYTTLNYKVRNLLRKTQRQTKLLNEIPLQNSYLEEHLIISAEIASQVRQAISALPEQTGRVLELSLMEMSQEEIAEQMGISVNTVKTLKKAGYKTLRESLAHLKAILPLMIS